MTLDNKQAALRIPPVWKWVVNAIVTGKINILFLEKQAFSPEFSHTLELKYKVRLA